MKKLLAMLLAALMVLGGATAALADPGSEPDWTEYNQLIAEIKSTTDFVEREAMMHKAEDILMDTGAIVPIYYYNDLFMMKPTVKGLYYNVYGFKFFDKVTVEGSDTFRLNLASEPDKLDPALNSSVDGACLAIAAFGGLYTYDAESNLVPNYATGYEVSEDGLTYVFTMRDGLKWSDGTELNAKDFEYSWKRAAAPETAADYGYMYDGIARDENGEMMVSASEDGKTLTVVVSTPCAYMLDLMAFPAFFAVNQACVEAAEGFKDEDGNVLNAGAWALEAGYVCSGPFMLESWNHNQSMTYVKNPNYWDAENVKIEKLEFMLSADDTAIMSAYQAGDVDFIDTVPSDQIPVLKGNPEFYIVDNLGTYYVIFNVKSPMFDGMTVEQAANMRKALGKLIDRDYIIETVAQCEQVPANTFIPAGMLDGHGGVFKANDDAYTFPVDDEVGGPGYYSLAVDEEGARELLKSAGFKFDESGMLSAETPLSFEYICNEGTGHVGVAECMQQDFAVLGINMTIKVIDWNVFLNERKAGTYDFARNGWLCDFNDPINMLEMWETDSGNNDAQFGR